MFMFKGCPRCHGDLCQNRDIYGEFMYCLQCGYYLSDSEMETFLAVSSLRGELVTEDEPELALVA